MFSLGRYEWLYLCTCLNRIEMFVGNWDRLMGVSKVLVGTRLLLILRVANISEPIFARSMMCSQTIKREYVKWRYILDVKFHL
jgi:hypothetical protein